jgi:hypothetical protein
MKKRKKTQGKMMKNREKTMKNDEQERKTQGNMMKKGEKNNEKL